MQGRNPLAGRHAAGSAIARSGTRPPSRKGSPSGSFAGTGLNRKTAARPEYQAGIAQKNDNGQIDQWNRQAPEPFRNSQPSANPRSYQTGPSSSVGGAGGRTGAAGAMTGSAGIGRQVPSQSATNTATGHKASYSYKNLTPLNSGAKIKPPKSNTDNGSQPNATRKFKSNADIFNEGLASYKKWGA